MQFLAYILVYPFIMLLSILPFRILYFISDCFYYLIYYIIGYRKKTVLYNLKLAFPKKSDKEIKTISKKFYHHFVDLFLEMIKTFTISNEEILKRFYLTNKEELTTFLNKHQNVLLMSSHYANYEWLFSLNLSINHNGFGAYKKLKNNYFDKLIRKSRGRFNTQLVSTKEFFRTVDQNDAKQIPCIYGLLSDQSPRVEKTHHWSEFFGVKVPVYTGTEMLAKKYNYSIIYMKTAKVKRGYYQTTMHILSETPTKVPDYQISDLFMQKLEGQIIKKPEYYFWTHKRFKHKDKAPISLGSEQSSVGGGL